jgi:hypothetical protein
VRSLAGFNYLAGRRTNVTASTANAMMTMAIRSGTVAVILALAKRRTGATFLKSRNLVICVDLAQSGRLTITFGFGLTGGTGSSILMLRIAWCRRYDGCALPLRPALQNSVSRPVPGPTGQWQHWSPSMSSGTAAARSSRSTVGFGFFGGLTIGGFGRPVRQLDAPDPHAAHQPAHGRTHQRPPERL